MGSQDYLSTIGIVFACMYITFIILFLNKLLDSLAFYFLSTKIFYEKVFTLQIE